MGDNGVTKYIIAGADNQFIRGCFVQDTESPPFNTLLEAQQEITKINENLDYEGFDINNEYDWKLAEELIQSGQVLLPKVTVSTYPSQR